MAIQITGLVAVFFIIVLIDLNRLKSVRTRKGAISIYFTILVFSFTIGLLLIIDKTPPSPATYIEKAIDVFLSR